MCSELDPAGSNFIVAQTYPNSALIHVMLARSAPSGKQEEKLIEADETAQEQAGAGENNATQQTISVYFRRAFNGLLWLASTLSMNLSNKARLLSRPV